MKKRKSAKKRVLRTEHDIETEGLPSGSKFDADFRCLGKFALEAQIPREDDTTASRRGHKIHKALEHSDLNELSPSDQITASRIMFGEAEIVHEHGFEGAKVVWETRFWDSDDFRPLWSARLDTLHILSEEERLLVIDSKTGWGIPQSIENNWQIRGQVVLAARQYPARSVVGAIVHPHHPDSLYEVKTFDPKEIAASLITIRKFVELIQKPNQPRTPNGVSCTFCRAKGICPEYKAQMKKIAQAIADEREDKGFTAIIRQTPEERGQRVKELKLFKTDIENIMEQYVTLIAKDENAIQGFGLRRRYTKEITHEGKAIECIEDEFGEEALTHAMELSLARLEEFLGKKLKSKKEAKLQIEQALGRYLRFKPSRQWLEERRTI